MDECVLQRCRWYRAMDAMCALKIQEVQGHGCNECFKDAGGTGPWMLCVL